MIVIRTVQADVDAIERIHREYTASINAGNVEQVLASLTTDAILLPPNEPPAAGLEEVRSWFQRLADHIDQITFTEATLILDEIVVAGDWAFSRATLHVTIQPKAGGPSVSDATKTILIWQRQPNGSWKISHDIWNSNNPPPGGQ
ncbi:MAG: DUF4440 domain-containing protein [Actinobacteria bacterium]|nr:DUF4440 domain-containing protein [Actinomycetota bacterium]